MKLKYYLRALGIGIVVTAILMGVAGKPALSDETVRKRAKELGMVDGSSLVLSNLQENDCDTETKNETVPADNVSIPKVDINAVEDEQTIEVVPEKADNEESNQQPDTSVQDTSEQDTSVQDTSLQDIAENHEEEIQSEFITIQILGGASSVSVSRQLEQEGLVDDWAEFDSYLCANGYDKVISVGTYEIPRMASQEEIAKIITGKK